MWRAIFSRSVLFSWLAKHESRSTIRVVFGAILALVYVNWGLDWGLVNQINRLMPKSPMTAPK